MLDDEALPGKHLLMLFIAYATIKFSSKDHAATSRIGD